MLAGIDIIALDFKPVVREVPVLCRIKRSHIAGIERIITIAALENPAIGSLRTEISLYIRDILTDLICLCPNGILICRTVDINDRDIESAAVIRGVFF